MNETQQKILEFAKTTDINQCGVRELARMLDVHPETAKYHRRRLIDAGHLKNPNSMFSACRTDVNILGGADLVTIPFLGAANCGLAQHIAGSEPEGALKLSSRFLKSKQYESLFAVKADGSSMNNASIDGSAIATGDYVIVEANSNPTAGDCVVAVVDGLANIKQFQPEYNNGELCRIALLSQSTEPFEPIFIHPDDQADGLIAGVVVQVVKRAQ